jgi:hypothetical protein
LIVTVMPLTLIVPDRAAPGFAATVKETDAFPLPLVLPELIVIQPACEVTLQLQDAPVVTLTDWTPPAVGAATVDGPTEIVQAPFWMTLTTWPETLTLPVRVELPGFDAITNVTQLVPDPAVPSGNEIHDVEVDAFQEQLWPARTSAYVVKPEDGAVTVGGVTAMPHDDCTTVNTSPAMLSVPVRVWPPGFAATL